MTMPRLHHQRLDYLDAARAFALILGIVFHASLSFMPIFIGWAVMDVSTSSIVSLFVMIAHSFRMELFFLIAGFFSHMSFHQQGALHFIRSRLMRIAIPFVVGWFLLRPLLVSAWIIGGDSMRGEANILTGLYSGFASLAKLPIDFLVGTHLWFLYYLLLISALAVTLRYLLALNKPLQRKVMQLSDNAMRWLCRSNFAICVLAIPTAFCVWFMHYWSVDTPDKTLVPNIPVLFIYGGFFLFGWLLHRQIALIEYFSRVTLVKVVLCLVGVIATIILYNLEAKLNHPRYDLLKGCFVVFYAAMMWSLVAMTIGLFKRFFDRTNKMIRYLADSSYWIYLIHLPIVIFLQVAFAELSLHWSIKLFGISSLTVFVSILLYDAFIRSTLVGALLNGKRKPRLLFYHRELAKKSLAV
jgi:glucan biosynthesis protein C